MGFKGGDSFEVEGEDNGNVEFRAEVLSAFFSMEWECEANFTVFLWVIQVTKQHRIYFCLDEIGFF